MLREDRSDGVPHCAILRNSHDLGDLVGQVDLKHVALVALDQVEMLREGEEREEGRIRSVSSPQKVMHHSMHKKALHL